MKLIKTSIVILLLIIGQKAYSQIGITYYSSNALGANLALFKVNNSEVTAELRIFANREFKEIPMELDVFYRFKPGVFHRFSVGLGFQTEPFTDGGIGNVFLIPSSLEIFPFRKQKRISFLFELTPEILFEGPLKLRSLIGLRYTFGKN